MKKIIIALILLLSVSTSKSTEVNLIIDYNVDGTPFMLNTEYVNADDIKYKISRFEYYMRQFELDGQSLDGIYVLANGKISNYNLGDLDIESVHKMKLSFGVEKKRKYWKGSKPI